MLKTFPDNHFHAVVCDPPYELGFMARQWDNTGVAYDPFLWGQVKRVLRPGGYLLAFGGSRTYHRMACAIEDAGFILHPMIGWVQGQGFPKATNLGKMLDKSVGAERVISGKMRGHVDSNGVHDDDNYVWEPVYDRKDIPATPEAKAWDGWYYGRQSLKPALEPICMAQKPPEGRMVDNIRAYGCGGINVDGCRIGNQTELHASKPQHERNGFIKGFVTGTNTEKKEYGRFPSNLILSHSPNCVKVGRKKIKPLEGHRPNPVNIQSDGNIKFNNKEPGFQKVSYTDSTGHEEIDDYLCSEDCPIRLMGEQSRISKTSPHRCKKTNGDADIFNNSINEAFTHLNDQGTAARFFLNIEPEEGSCGPLQPLQYDPFYYCPKASSSERMGSKFPTIKPKKLIKYLVTLITPPGGLVLDPFLGSGTTGLACNELGFDWVGIDLDTHFAEERLVTPHKPLTSF